MLKKLSFTTRIMLLPTLAAIAFLALVATTQAYNTVNSRHLDRFENGLYPSLVLAVDLEADLKETHGLLVGAADAQFEDFLTQADGMRDGIREQLTAAKTNPLVDTVTIRTIEAKFEEYYRTASLAARQAIDGETGLGLAANQERMRTLFNEIKGMLSDKGEEDRKDMTAAFTQLRSRQQASLYVSLLVSAISLALVGWVSLRVLANVRTLTAEVTGSATQINSSSSQVLQTSRQQETAASQHASAIEETRTTIQSLTESSRSIARLAEAVLENAQQTLRTNQEIAERNSHLISHLEGISTILESVKDIANKSELLALNAALEGTKAGEAGRGFSLVAAQMQRLAENVMGNVRDIQRLTNDVQEASRSAVLAIEEGTKLAEQTTQSARQIRLVTQQQESATEQVTISMNDASIQVQQTVAAVRESTQAMESLVQLASQLNELLLKLRLMEQRQIA